MTSLSVPYFGEHGGRDSLPFTTGRILPLDTHLSIVNSSWIFEGIYHILLGKCFLIALLLSLASNGLSDGRFLCSEKGK